MSDNLKPSPSPDENPPQSSTDISNNTINFKEDFVDENEAPPSIMQSKIVPLGNYSIDENASCINSGINLAASELNGIKSSCLSIEKSDIKNSSSSNSKIEFNSKASLNSAVQNKENSIINGQVDGVLKSSQGSQFNSASNTQTPNFDDKINTAIEIPETQESNVFNEVGPEFSHSNEYSQIAEDPHHGQFPLNYFPYDPHCHFWPHWGPPHGHNYPHWHHWNHWGSPHEHGAHEFGPPHWGIHPHQPHCPHGHHFQHWGPPHVNGPHFWGPPH